MSLPTGQISIQTIMDAYNSVYPALAVPHGLSEIRGAAFTDGTSVPATGPLSMDTFRGKTFGTSGGTGSV
jgi:hypothetical protein